MRSSPRTTLLALVALTCSCFSPAGSGEGSSGGSSTGAPGTTGAPTTGPTSTGTTASDDTGTSSGDASTTGTTGATTGDGGVTGTTDDPDTTGGGSTGVPGVCGDGVPDKHEICDDGNLTPGDGCDENCERDAHFVFASSAFFPVTSLDPREAADAECEALAVASTGLPVYARSSAYVAWLSDGSVHARDRLGVAAGPYRRPDLAMVAASTPDLIDLTELESTISVDENNAPIPEDMSLCGSNYVWTGSDAAGMSTDSHCEAWTKADINYFATAGLTRDKGNSWTDETTCGCLAELRIYCFEVG